MSEIVFGICHRCKKVDYKALVLKLKTKYPNAKFDIKCQSYCGAGSLYPFIAINEVFIDANSIDELLVKVSNYMESNYVR